MLAPYWTLDPSIRRQVQDYVDHLVTELASLTGTPASDITASLHTFLIDTNYLPVPA